MSEQQTLLEKRQLQGGQLVQKPEVMLKMIKQSLAELTEKQQLIINEVASIKELLQSEKPPEDQQEATDNARIYTMSNNGSSWYSFYLDGKPVLDNDGEPVKIQGKEEAQAHLNQLNNQQKETNNE